MMSAVWRGIGIGKLRSTSSLMRSWDLEHLQSYVTSAMANYGLEAMRMTRPIIEVRSNPMAYTSKRMGVISIKCGMIGFWDKWGQHIPTTVLWLDANVVTQVKTIDKEGFNALQIGCGHKKRKHLTKPELGHFRAQGVPLKRKLREFPVSKDALFPIGTHLGVRHLYAGQHIDVTGITKNKGFQGVMKRWGFKGGPASHGCSKAHRKPGSTRGRQDPGRLCSLVSM